MEVRVTATRLREAVGSVPGDETFGDGAAYLLAGNEAPAIEQRGDVLLVVDETLVDPAPALLEHGGTLRAEPARLKTDLVADGR